MDIQKGHTVILKEELHWAPQSSFSKMAAKILETACLMTKAEGGILFMFQKGKVLPQAIYKDAKYEAEIQKKIQSLLEKQEKIWIHKNREIFALLTKI
ncbi:MAG: hypothetical protein D6785_02935, partial [Planctomycetota bacterium]